MKRVAAHYLYIHPELIIKKGVIEIDDNGVVADYFSLDGIVVESTNTEFYTGLLAPAFVPFTKENAEKILSGFHFTDHTNLSFTKKPPYIINTGNLDLHQTAHLLWKIQQLLPWATIIDLINWGSYFPENISGDTAGVVKGSRKDIWLFENIDLINMKITSKTTIRKI